MHSRDQSYVETLSAGSTFIESFTYTAKDNHLDADTGTAFVTVTVPAEHVTAHDTSARSEERRVGEERRSGAPSDECEDSAGTYVLTSTARMPAYGVGQ